MYSESQRINLAVLKGVNDPENPFKKNILLNHEL